MYKLTITNKAYKQLKKLPHVFQEKVIDRVHKLDFPFPKNLDIKSMTNTAGFYRLRVGKIRILFELDVELKKIVIRQVGYRGDVYKN